MSELKNEIEKLCAVSPAPTTKDLLSLIRHQGEVISQLQIKLAALHQPENVRVRRVLAILKEEIRKAEILKKRGNTPRAEAFVDAYRFCMRLIKEEIGCP